MTNDTLESLQQHQLVILRRLRGGPLTEFELAAEIANHSGYTVEECMDSMAGWLGDLRAEGLLWVGELTNAVDQHMLAAALTKVGKELVG